MATRMGGKKFGTEFAVITFYEGKDEVRLYY